MHETETAELARRTAEKIYSEERLRFEILQGVHAAAQGRVAADVNAAPFADVLSVPLERVFAVVEFLSRSGYLAYRGAGPRVALTRRGLDYLESDSERRGTLRD